MKRNIFSVALAIILAIALLAACASPGGTGGGAAAPDVVVETREDGRPIPTGRPLIVGTIPNHVGLPVHYAMVNGLFEEVGLDIRLEVFVTGAPINEAMAAGALDLAVSGQAGVHGLATGMYTYIGDGVFSLSGEYIFARPDSPIALAGANAAGLIGSAETVRGATFIGPLGTVAQAMVIRYAERFGLTADEVSMVGMDFSQGVQAFLIGEGDLVVARPPEVSELIDLGYVIVAGFQHVFDATVTDTIFVQDSVAAERPGDLELFLYVYYKASTALMADEARRREVTLDLFASEGVTLTEADLDREIASRAYWTFDTIDPDRLGSFMIEIGEFFTYAEMISQENFPNIEASFDSSFLRNMLEWAR